MDSRARDSEDLRHYRMGEFRGAGFDNLTEPVLALSQPPESIPPTNEGKRTEFQLSNRGRWLSWRVAHFFGLAKRHQSGVIEAVRKPPGCFVWPRKPSH